MIRKQAALRRGHLPLRRLLDQASDVLFALKPCWAMSPLMVSQVLPATRLFDVVIFDEASQIVPADAIGSMIRAHQVVVAGDDRQLPPTNFFRQIGDSGDPADDDGRATRPRLVRPGFESVLDALRPLLPTCPLTWHYRSRDERLVAFSNERIYGGALTTFPGVARDDCLRHVVVAQAAGARPGGLGGRRGRRGGPADPRARADPAGGVARRDRARRQARRADRRRAARGAGQQSRRSRRSSPRTGPSRSSSRTWSGCRATSGTRSSCPSATASTRTGGCATSGGRCCATAASAG